MLHNTALKISNIQQAVQKKYILVIFGKKKMLLCNPAEQLFASYKKDKVNGHILTILL